MRFVLVSTHIDQTTGYSKVAFDMLKQIATLSSKVKIFHFGFQRHPARMSIRKYPEGVKSYDAGANEDPKEEGFGFNKINDYLEMVNPDVVMIYNDPIVVCQFIQSMKYEPGKSPYKLWVYLDQVYEGIANVLVETIRKNAERIYCFSELWKRKFLEYGPASDVRVLEHAVDTSLFSSLSVPARDAIRTNVNVPKDSTIILNANRNSQRKRLDLTVQGFVRALAKNPNICLMIVTNLQPQSGAFYDVQRIYLEELKLQNMEAFTYIRNLVLIDSSGQNIIDDEGINQLYNLADIGINTSDGEGYGLCQLEHMYTGAPQIVTDVGTYRTFLSEQVATFIQSSGREYFAGSMPHGLWRPTFSAESVAEGILSAVKTLPEKREALSKYSFKSWAKVCDEFLEDLLMLQTSNQASSVSVPVTSLLPSS
jgi:glycosyltransferase involved in cell wall biosynthesis